MLYLNPKTNQFHFIPWDLDLSFGGFAFFNGDQTQWSIAQPTPARINWRSVCWR